MTTPRFPISPAAPLDPVPYDLPCLNVSSLSPPYVSPPLSTVLSSFPTHLGETKTRKLDHDRVEKSDILAAPFREKPVSGGGEPEIIYFPWTRTELRNQTKDFPDLL